MLNLLFVLGLLVGIGGAVIAVTGVVVAVVTAIAWLRALIVDPGREDRAARRPR